MKLEKKSPKPAGKLVTAALCLLLLGGPAAGLGAARAADGEKAASTRSKGTATRSSSTASRTGGSRSAAATRSGTATRSSRAPAASASRTRVSRGRTSVGIGVHGHRGRFHYRYPYWPFYRPYYSLYSYWGYPYYFYPWGWGVYVGAYPEYRYYRGDLGALDINVRPKKAEVYVDGQYVGRADRFDGFPSYLWLEPGTYQLAFYKPGFETLTRELRVQPGVILDVDGSLGPGEAVRPEAPAPAATPRRDERLRRNRERAEEARRYEEEERRYEEEAATYDARGEPGQLRLKVAPPDASIYLDGRFLGTAEELTGLRSGLIVDAGEHRLEVVRPGYASRQVDFEVAAGEEAEISLSLDAE